MSSRRSPEQQLALITAHRQITTDIRTRLLAYLALLWGRMDSWSDTAADQLLTAALPAALGAQRSTATATAAFQHAWLEVAGSTTKPVQMAAVTGAALRGVDPAIVYRRPVIQSRATYARLKKAGGMDRQQIIDAAIEAGLRRLLGTASTDLQLTATLTSQQVLQTHGVQQYRRVTRPGACPLCQLASDRVYRTADLLPIHSGCHCIVLPGGLLPEALQRASNTDRPDGAGRGLKIGENGEIGPVLQYGKKPARPRKATSGGASSGNGGTKPPTPPGAGQPDDIPDFGHPLASLEVDAGEVGARPSALSFEDALRFSIDEDFIGSSEVAEKRAADWLRSLGMTVRKVRNIQDRRTPDAVVTAGYWSGKTVEFKTAVSLNALRNQIQIGSEQSPQLVVDLTGDYADPTLVERAIQLGVQQAPRRLDEIIVRHPDFRLRWTRTQQGGAL